MHLSSITRLIEASLPSQIPSLPFTLTEGPFAGLSLPHATAAANAAHITRSLVDTYLITHPHLDHISGLVVNTAGLPGARPKKVAGLPSTIQALKTHIFNNVIWPNLSDENNGAGLITYLRLVEGGSPALGDGEGKGYLEICDGLQVKTWSISHGHCIERHSHRGSTSSVSTRFGSHDASSIQTPRRDFHSHHSAPPRTSSLFPQVALGSPSFEQERYCVYDSSAYFIQDQNNHREVLIFGDVEPDSISLSPRNLQIWQEAGPKIAAGNLRGIFIECSYDDSQSNDRLFGHLKPCFVIEELQVLAAEVEVARKMRSIDSKKRKRMSSHEGVPRRKPSIGDLQPEDPVSPKTVKASFIPETSNHILTPDTPHLATPTAELTLRELESFGPALEPMRPLEGLKVVIIHVKDKLSDGPDVGDVILAELLTYEKEAQLGCEFIISRPGQSIYL